MKMCKFWKAITAAALTAGLAFGEPEVAEVLGYTSSVAFAASAPSVPTVSLKPGSYLSFKDLSVALSCSTPGAKVFYKLDGGKYQELFDLVPITKNTTLYYYSEKNGVKSKVQSAKYELLPDVDILLDVGSTVNASISTPLTGVTCYYTTDGSKPTTKSKKLNGSIKLKKSCTLRVMAKKSGWSPMYFSREITVGKPVYENDLLNDYTKKYYYSQLNSTEKTAYQRIFNSMMNFEDKVDVSDLKLATKKVWAICSTVLYENPQIFWWKKEPDVYGHGGIASYVSMQYHYTRKEAEQRAKKLEARAKEIVSSAKKQPNTFLCVKYLHDTLALESYYEGNTSEYKEVKAFYSRADNQLLDGRGVCAGYGHAFTYLCQMAGVPCIGIWGYIKGYDSGHMWNKVKLGGNWYIVDTTWDDSGTDEVGYSYFCITDDDTNGERTPYEGLPLENAVSTSEEYTYLNGMGVIVYQKPEEVVGMGLKRVADALKKGELEFDLYFDPDIKDKTIEKLKNNFYPYLSKYGAYAKMKTMELSDNRVHIVFEPLSDIGEAVTGVMTSLDVNNFSLTLVAKPSVAKELKSKLGSLLKANGYFAASATCTVKNSITKVKVTPYQTMKDITAKGLNSILGYIRNGRTVFTLFCKNSLKKDIHEKMPYLLLDNGVSLKGTSSAVSDQYIRFTLIPHDTVQQVIDNGMKMLADNYRKKVYTTTIVFSKEMHDQAFKKLYDSFYDKAKALGVSCQIDHWEWWDASVTITVK